jgi:hydroxymethylbilane synthase
MKKSNNHTIRIGTRDSELALWQAREVKRHLDALCCDSELVFIKSEGDIDLTTPLYEMGVQGIFTKTLDGALLNNRIDIAVHALKDVPVQAAQGLSQAAVLKRGSYKDILVFKENASFLSDNTQNAVIATSSIRRKAQWLHRYPHHQIENLRGNVNTRLQKLTQQNWSGAIFAAAGLERINLRPETSIDLNWMLPAPAQGAIAVYCRTQDVWIIDICKSFNDAETALCTSIERSFLKKLMGGCSAPIAALAQLVGDSIVFKGCVLSVDGREKWDVEKTTFLDESTHLVEHCTQELFKRGAAKLINAA